MADPINDLLTKVRADNDLDFAAVSADGMLVGVDTAEGIDAESVCLTAGDIFHGPLSWPWADDDAPLETPAQRWGVDTTNDRVLLCGSGARRGGAVSGLGGHNAAMAALELLG